MCGKCEVNYGNNLHWSLEVSGILLETCCPLEMSNHPGKGRLARSSRKAAQRQPVSGTSAKVRLTAFLQLGLAFLFSSTHNPPPCPCSTKDPRSQKGIRGPPGPHVINTAVSMSSHPAWKLLWSRSLTRDHATLDQ